MMVEAAVLDDNEAIEQADDGNYIDMIERTAVQRRQRASRATPRGAGDRDPVALSPVVACRPGGHGEEHSLYFLSISRNLS